MGDCFRLFKNPLSPPIDPVRRRAEVNEGGPSSPEQLDRDRTKFIYNTLRGDSFLTKFEQGSLRAAEERPNDDWAKERIEGKDPYIERCRQGYAQRMIQMYKALENSERHVLTQVRDAKSQDSVRKEYNKARDELGKAEKKFRNKNLSDRASLEKLWRELSEKVITTIEKQEKRAYGSQYVFWEQHLKTPSYTMYLTPEQQEQLNQWRDNKEKLDQERKNPESRNLWNRRPELDQDQKLDECTIQMKDLFFIISDRKNKWDQSLSSMQKKIEELKRSFALISEEKVKHIRGDFLGKYNTVKNALTQLNSEFQQLQLAQNYDQLEQQHMPKFQELVESVEEHKRTTDELYQETNDSRYRQHIRSNITDIDDRIQNLEQRIETLPEDIRAQNTDECDQMRNKLQNISEGALRKQDAHKLLKSLYALDKRLKPHEANWNTIVQQRNEIIELKRQIQHLKDRRFPNCWRDQLKSAWACCCPNRSAALLVDD
jgi:hypothetical protein